MLTLSLAFAPGKAYRYGNLSFYAMNGCICLIDEEDGDFQTLTRKEFLLRAQTLSEGAKRMGASSHRWHYQDRTETQSVVADMIECCQEAADQGDHFDPAVAAWFTRHRPGRKSLVSMSGKANFSSGRPSRLPRGRHTGRTAVADFSAGTPRANLANINNLSRINVAPVQGIRQLDL